MNTHKPSHKPASLALTLFMSIGLCVAGCASQPQESRQPVADSPNRAVPALPSVFLWPEMTSIQATPVFPDSMGVGAPATVQVDSLVQRIQIVQYRVIWLDARGEALNPSEPFKILNLAPKVSRTISEKDPTGKATTWRAEFRPAG